MSSATQEPAPYERPTEEHEGRRVSAFVDDALGDLDATGVADAIRSGELSAVEVMEAAIGRVERVDTDLGALAHDDYARARRRAAALATVGQAPFAGVPTAIKDNVHAAGAPMSVGSDATPTHHMGFDGPFVSEILDAGLVPVGSTHLPPFGWTATTERPRRRVTRNPWDTRYSSGGSSGGSAALVASGALPIAHGNDGGGSIRIPAAACGLVGLKVTRGRFPVDPTHGSMPVKLVTEGVLTRTVRDTAGFVAAVEGHLPGTRWPEIGHVEGPGARLRIGVLVDSPLAPATDEVTASAVRGVAELLASLGHEVGDHDPKIPASFREDFQDYWSLLAFAISTTGRRMLGADFDPARLDVFTRGLAARFRRRAHRSPLVLTRLGATGRVYDRGFGPIDVMLTPVLTHTTPRIGYLGADVDFETHFQRVSEYVGFTPLHNAAGAPAISLPLGSTADGRPVGVMLSARRGGDRLLLELAHELEAAAPFARIDAAAHG